MTSPSDTPRNALTHALSKANLTAAERVEALNFDYAERCAIREIDGEMPRLEAEWAAASDIARRYGQELPRWER